MGTHQIKINVPDHLKECTLRIEDFSFYDSLLPYTSPTLQVKVPGFPECVTFNLSNTPELDKNFVLNINACMLGLQTENCGLTNLKLPDGIYTISYSVAPNKVLYDTVYHLRTAILENQILCEYKELKLACCEPSTEMVQKLNHLAVIEGYLKSAKALAYYDHDCSNAIMLYEYAKALLDKLNCKMC